LLWKRAASPTRVAQNRTPELGVVRPPLVGGSFRELRSPELARVNSALSLQRSSRRRAECGLGGSADWSDGGQNPLWKRRLYDQRLTDWASKCRRSRLDTESACNDIAQLRIEVARQQQEVDDSAEMLAFLESSSVEVAAKFHKTMGDFEMMTQQRDTLAMQMAVGRKERARLSKEFKLLTADFDRRHKERCKMAEVRDQLDAQLSHLVEKHAFLSDERQKFELELTAASDSLLMETELAEQVHDHLADFSDGVRDSMYLYLSVSRPSLSGES